jgi:hypothetical protein
MTFGSRVEHGSDERTRGTAGQVGISTCRRDVAGELAAREIEHHVVDGYKRVDFLLGHESSPPAMRFGTVPTVVLGVIIPMV